MRQIKKILVSIFIFFFLQNLVFSKINFQIIMKIDNQIITSYDIEKETNYLLALNPQLSKMDKSKLSNIAKKSLTKEIIRKGEILKYKELNLENSQINNVLNNLIQNLNLTDEEQLDDYLKNFEISVIDLKRKIEIENEWKNLIYSKYIENIKIDKDELLVKIESISKNNFLIEYNLSEIVFTNSKDASLNELKEIIQSSIENDGFENTANLFSISDSAKLGGKVGWVKENNLTSEIVKLLKNLEINQYSTPIKINNNMLILKINEKRKIPIKIDKQKELDKMIMIETSKQLEKYSNIFYNKIKLNRKISEF